MDLVEVRELFAYNAWANRECFAALERVPAESYFRDLKSSHGGLHGTLCHIVWAEALWLNRWLKRPNPAVPQGKDLTTLAAARDRWEGVEAERGAFLAGFDERRLADTMTVRPSSGGEYVHAFGQMFRHVVDHSSYHRGQLITLLRQVGVRPPSPGLILFYRR
jgi:uncharacterized damage-inducible protein DinB